MILLIYKQAYLKLPTAIICKTCAGVTIEVFLTFIVLPFIDSMRYLSLTVIILQTF